MPEGKLNRRGFLRNLVAGALGAGIPNVANASGGNPNRTSTPKEENETPPSALENTTYSFYADLPESIDTDNIWTLIPYQHELPDNIIKNPPGKLPDFQTMREVRSIHDLYNQDTVTYGTAKALQRMYLRISILLSPRTKEASEKYNQAKIVLKEVKDLEKILQSMNSSDPNYIKIQERISDKNREIKSLMNFEYREDIRNPRYLPESNIYTCNVHATDFMAVIFSELDSLPISQRIDDKGNPVRSGGRELNALGIMSWIETNKDRLEIKDVTEFKLEDKMYLLEQGYIFYGCYDYQDSENPDLGHNYIIFGVTDENGTKAILSQATTNITADIIDPKADDSNARKLLTPTLNTKGRYRLFALNPNNFQ